MFKKIYIRIIVEVWLIQKQIFIVHRNLGVMRHSGKNEKKYCVRKYFISKHPGTGRVEITVISEDITFPL